MTRWLMDNHSLFDVHVMLYAQNFAATDGWRATRRPLIRVADFPTVPKRFTATDIAAHMKRGLPHDAKMAADAGDDGIHAALLRLCHGFDDDDLRFDADTGTFWYVPFSKDIEVQ